MSRYSHAALRIQQALFAIIAGDTFYGGAEPKHLRTSIELLRTDLDGLVRILVERGLFSAGEHRDAIAQAAEREALELERRLAELKRKL